MEEGRRWKLRGWLTMACGGGFRLGPTGCFCSRLLGMSTGFLLRYAHSTLRSEECIGWEGRPRQQGRKMERDREGGWSRDKTSWAGLGWAGLAEIPSFRQELLSRVRLLPLRGKMPSIAPFSCGISGMSDGCRALFWHLGLSWL